MKQAATFKTVDQGFSSSKLGRLEDDPVLAWPGGGDEISRLVANGASATASAGHQMMNMLAGMIVNGPRGGGVSSTSGPGTSSALPIAAGVGGAAVGVAGAVALGGLGSGKKDEKKEDKKDKPKTDTGKKDPPATGAPTTGTTTATPTTTAADTKDKPTPPPPVDTSDMGFHPAGLSLTPLSTPEPLALPTSK